MNQDFNPNGSGPVFPVSNQDTYTLNGILYFRTAFLHKLGRERQILPVVSAVSMN